MYTHLPFMPFPAPLLKTTFLGRPQRFLANMTLPGGEQTLVYCANPGSLEGCLEVGNDALVWDSQNKKRKRRYTWRAIKIGKIWVGTDTHFANVIVEQVLLKKLLPCLEEYEYIEREVSVDSGTRIDFLLAGNEGECFIEVKSATVVKDGVATFPSSITPRGLRHLEVLTEKAMEGQRVMMLFIVQRSDATSFVINGACFPEYAIAYKKALSVGVEVVALGVSVTPNGIGDPKLLPIEHYY